MNKKYIVRLTEEERQQLRELVSKGKAAAYTIKHANILLMADATTEKWSDEQIAKALSVHRNTVRGLRQRFAKVGLAGTLTRKKPCRPSRIPMLDGEAQARLIALHRSKPPAGHDRWSLQLLANQLVELKVVERISHETVRKTLKKVY